MERTLRATRIVVAGMILLGGVLGIGGEMKLAALDQTVPQAPRVERAPTAHRQKAPTAPSGTRGLSFVERARSWGNDPCVAITSVTLPAGRPLAC